MKTNNVNTIAALLVSATILTGCAKQAESSAPAGKSFDVEKLFTTDGCSVYRFFDNLRYVYFTNCNGSTQTSETWGKNCVTQVGVD